MNPEEYPAVAGSTYSLFGQQTTTGEYYRRIGLLADELIKTFGSTANVLSITGKYRNSRIRLRGFLRSADDKAMGFIMKKLSAGFSEFTADTREYVNSLSWLNKMRDKGLATSEEQYFCTMLEVELMNRINRIRFIRADRRIALLPHCLRDLSRICRSEKEGFDNICKGCSGKCYIHSLNDLLSKYRVEPFIWMDGSFRKLYFEMKQNNRLLGIFGIACLAELKSGMEKCLKYDIPAVGIPLDANRCARWMGESYPNSVNLSEVEKLLQQV
jgi:hypothetical protein